MSDNAYTDPWAAAQMPYMRGKLAAAGATRAEIDDFERQFVHDAGWDHTDKERLLALGDGKLRAEVLSARADGRRDTETEEDEQARVAREADQAREVEQLTEAERVSAYAPHDVIAWVGRDLDRARALLTIEERHPTPRADLIASLLRVIDDANRGR